MQHAENIPVHTRPAAREDFDDLLTLGRGSYCRIILSRHRLTQKVVALRVIAKSMSEHSRPETTMMPAIKRDLSLRCLGRNNHNSHHGFVVEHHGWFETENKVFFVQEWCEAGDCARLFSKPNASLVKNVQLWAAEMLLGIKTLHTRFGLFDHFAPLENVLFTRDGHIRISPACLSRLEFKRIGDMNTTGRFVTVPWVRSPELLFSETGRLAAVPPGASDLWSFGAAVFRMRYGKYAFQCHTVKASCDAMRGGELQFPTTSSATTANNCDDDAEEKALRDLLSRLLCGQDLARRYRTVEQAMQHPYFTMNGMSFEKVERGEIPVVDWTPPAPRPELSPTAPLQGDPRTALGGVRLEVHDVFHFAK